MRHARASNPHGTVADTAPMSAVLALIAAAGISGVVALVISSFSSLRSDLAELRSESRSAQERPAG